MNYGLFLVFLVFFNILYSIWSNNIECVIHDLGVDCCCNLGLMTVPSYNFLHIRHSVICNFFLFLFFRAAKIKGSNYSLARNNIPSTLYLTSSCASPVEWFVMKTCASHATMTWQGIFEWSKIMKELTRIHSCSAQQPRFILNKQGSYYSPDNLCWLVCVFKHRPQERTTCLATGV